MLLTKRKSKCLATQVYRTVIPGLHSLPRGRPMTTEHICGGALWYTLNTDERGFVDLFMQAAIRCGVFSLHHCGQDCNQNHRYVRP